MLSTAKRKTERPVVKSSGHHLKAVPRYSTGPNSSLQPKPTCACGGRCPRCSGAGRVQRKLRVTQPGDAAEREADSIAARVMRAPAVSGPAPVNSVTAGTAVPAELASDLNGNGAVLDAPTRGFFESRFGTDFAGVRIHTGASAARLADAYDARAFTYGQHIVFNDGEYTPHTTAGRELMAHELAHVQQQRGSPALARQVMRACDKKTTGVDDPSAMLDKARATAISAVTAALAAFKPMKTVTLKLLDRHFHCPSNLQIIDVKKKLTAIKAALPAVRVNCRSASDPECAGGKPGSAEKGTNVLNTCPPWFSGMSDIMQAVTFVFTAAVGLGHDKRCRRGEACYDDYTRKTPEMLENPYSYGWFAVEAAKLSTPDTNAIPCRPLAIGRWVVVPPAAHKDPSHIRRLSGFDPIPKDSEIIEVYTDMSDKEFIYHDKIEAAKQYLPDEPKRYYFPGGRAP